MKRNLSSLDRALLIVGVAALSVHLLNAAISAQTNITEPVYRVAADNSAASATTPAVAAQPASAQTTAAQAVSAARLDFTKHDGEHPLAPVIRGLKASHEILDKSVRDYSCTFVKRERVADSSVDSRSLFTGHEPRRTEEVREHDLPRPQRVVHHVSLGDGSRGGDRGSRTARLMAVRTVDAWRGSRRPLDREARGRGENPEPAVANRPREHVGLRKERDHQPAMCCRHHARCVPPRSADRLR